MTKPKLLIVVASTRPNRIGRVVGDWFATAAGEHDGFEVDFVDLQELDLPMFDEPNHPRFKEYVHDHTKQWSAQVDAADAIVWVTPEYNHSFPASLKNAIDYLSQEWRNKALGYVSYGGIAAGTRAVQALKPVANAVGLVSGSNLVNLAWVAQKIEDGVFVEDEPSRSAANSMLSEMLVLDGALRTLRQPSA